MGRVDQAEGIAHADAWKQRGAGHIQQPVTSLLRLSYRSLRREKEDQEARGLGAGRG